MIPIGTAKGVKGNVVESVTGDIESGSSSVKTDASGGELHGFAKKYNGDTSEF